MKTEEELKDIDKDGLIMIVQELQEKNQELASDKEMYFKQYANTKRREEILSSIVKELSQLIN